MIELPEIVVSIPENVLVFGINLYDFAKITVDYNESYDYLKYKLFIIYKNNIVAT